MKKLVAICAALALVVACTIGKDVKRRVARLLEDFPA